MSERNAPLRILLVDDETRILSALSRRIHQLDPRAEIETAQGGIEALISSVDENFDLVISDLRMPRFSGDRLLRQLRRESPHTVRVILSGQAHIETLLETLPIAHQYLEKPCPSEKLLHILHALHLVRESTLPQVLQKQVLSLTSLPSDRMILDSLKSHIEREESNSALHSVIESDLGLSLGVYRLSSIVKSGKIGLNVHKTIEAIPVSLLKNLISSPLITPLAPDEELLQVAKIISLKCSLIRKHFERARIDNAYLLSLIAYMGELALMTCIGPAQGIRNEFKSHRDEITQILVHLWGLPKELLPILHEPDFLTLRDDIDDFLRVDEFCVHTKNGFLNNLYEVVCSIDA